MLALGVWDHCSERRLAIGGGRDGTAGLVGDYCSTYFFESDRCRQEALLEEVFC